MVKSNFPVLPRVVLACLGYFWFILPRSCLFHLVAVGYGFVPHFIKKVKAHKSRKKLETLKKVKASKVRKK